MSETPFECTIQQFSADGHGLGMITLPSGKTDAVEVPYTIPGEATRFFLRKRRKGIFSSCFPITITPSPDHITPRCPHFSSCGGCIWQNLSYTKQLEEKERQLHNLFTRTLDISPSLFSPIIPCEEIWHYRNKMEFSFSQNRAGDRFLGLCMNQGRGKVVDLMECHLCPPWFTEALHAVRDWWVASGLQAYHPPSDEGSLRTVTMRGGRHTGDKILMLTVSGNPLYSFTQQHQETLVRALEDISSLSLVLRVQKTEKGVPTKFYESVIQGSELITEQLTVGQKTLTFRIKPNAFFQPNTMQAEKIYSTALSMVNLSAETIVWDLYCGTGVFGILFSPYVKKVVGIELEPHAVLSAQENMRLNGVSNMEVIEGDVGKILAERSFTPPDIILVDPPRSGLDLRAIEQLLQIGAKQIIYVSCNYKTQAADLQKIIDNERYHITSIQPIDQFPFTRHLENIVLLKSNFV